eukprot:611996-Pleurochrysis_carterae.AAC.4
MSEPSKSKPQCSAADPEVATKFKRPHPGASIRQSSEHYGPTHLHVPCMQSRQSVDARTQNAACMHAFETRRACTP